MTFERAPEFADGADTWRTILGSLRGDKFEKIEDLRRHGFGKRSRDHLKLFCLGHAKDLGCQAAKIKARNVQCNQASDHHPESTDNNR